MIGYYYFRLFTAFEAFFSIFFASPFYTLMLSTFSFSHQHLRLLSLVVWFCSDRVVQPIFGHHLSLALAVLEQCYHGILDITSLLPPAVTISNWNRNNDKNWRYRNCQKQTHEFPNNSEWLWGPDLLESTCRSASITTHVEVRKSQGETITKKDPSNVSAPNTDAISDSINNVTDRE